MAGWRQQSVIPCKSSQPVQQPVPFEEIHLVRGEVVIDRLDVCASPFLQEELRGLSSMGIGDDAKGIRTFLTDDHTGLYGRLTGNADRTGPELYYLDIKMLYHCLGQPQEHFIKMLHRGRCLL